jgi:acyl-CoA thioester hydrolase
MDVGNRSFTLSQALFQDGNCAATAESVMVLVDVATRKSTPLTEEVLSALAKWGEGN